MTELSDNLRDQLRQARGHRPGRITRLQDLPKALALTMEARAGQYIQVGQMKMWQTQRGSIWLQDAKGDGMEVPLTKMETCLRQFFRKHF